VATTDRYPVITRTVGPATGSNRALSLTRGAVLACGFVVTVALRITIGGPGPGHSQAAALVFAGCLALLSAAAGTRLTVTPRDLVVGLAGAALICAPPALVHLVRPSALPDLTGFAAWAVVVSVVAAAEEGFLRGALYDALHAVGGTGVAVAGAAVAFALLHVPIYGWQALPLDFAVGLVLGFLRHRSGSATAPAIAHIIADFGGWFLR
jgi:membrane protease YdiL (CAAX protease family)